jgi:hypothetical protein
MMRSHATVPVQQWVQAPTAPSFPILESKYLLGVAIALDTNYTGHVPDIDPKTATGQQADDYMDDRTARIWSGLVVRPDPAWPFVSRARWGALTASAGPPPDGSPGLGDRTWSLRM